MSVWLMWLPGILFLTLVEILVVSGLVMPSNIATWSIKVHENWTLNCDNWKHKDLDAMAALIAADVGAESLGQIGELRGYYLLIPKHTDHEPMENLILNHEGISWHSKQSFLNRVKRRPLPKRGHVSEPLNSTFPLRTLDFKDPLYRAQWHLSNNEGYDCNVTAVWTYNITGKGVVVAVVDDGVEWRHPDLIDNYCKEGSFDLNSDDDDPTPVYDKEEENKHGTRCAGEISAVPNSVCGVGIAFESKFSGIRVLDGQTTDATEATAFNKHMDINDIYSCSWGPEDNGVSVDGPHPLGKLALQHGVVAGRKGFGSIFVVASGNGGDNGDNCNYDGYANSIYTITIGAVDEFGRKPPYSEECTSMIASSLSSGVWNARSIVTTDWTLSPNNVDSQCTRSHTGTSAATPLAAGMVALMLQACPCLTWRDVQHIIVMTAVKVDKEAAKWTENAVGFSHSDSHGFGLMNAWRLVNAAKIWKPVPWLASLSSYMEDEQNLNIPCCDRDPLVLKVKVNIDDCKRNMIATLEHIDFQVNIKHFGRGKLRFAFICPSGTLSVIPTRQKDLSYEGLHWTFSTVKCWGEKPFGTYTLKITDTSNNVPAHVSLGILVSWKLTIYGSQWTAEDVLKRKELVFSSFSGKYLNNSEMDCPSGETLDFDITTALSESTIKLLTMLSCFFSFWAIYYVVEVAFCDVEGKEKADSDEVELQQNGDPNSDVTVTFMASTFSHPEENAPVGSMSDQMNHE